MGLTKDYAKFLHGEFGLRPVWPPTEPIAPGDYGEFDDGVFVKIGNVSEDFGITCPITAKKANFDMDCQSNSTKMITADINGQMKIITKNTSGQAQISVNFKKENSFFIRAAKLRSNALKSINKTSHTIKYRTTARQWNHIKWWVISEVYEAPSAIVLGSRSRNSSVVFSGEAKALVKIYDGEIAAGVSISGKSNTNLKILGQAGPVLLRIFRVRVNGNPVIR